jgi:hypothetical protein
MNRFVLLLISMMLASEAKAQLTAYIRYTPNTKDVWPAINFYSKKELNQKVDLSVFTFISPTFSEVLIGPNYKLWPWLSVGISAGLEHQLSIYRFGASIRILSKTDALILLVEKGGGSNNYFYRAFYRHNFEKIFIGANAWRFHGVGPNFGFQISGIQSEFWLSPLYDFEFETPRVITGLTYKF